MTHQQIVELLPWYVNKSLDDSERRMIEIHLGECRECGREMETLFVLRKAVVEAETHGPALPPGAFQRALTEIEKDEDIKARAGTPQLKQFSRAFKVLANISTRWWRPTPLIARVLITAQMAVVLALGGIVLYRQAHPDGSYITSSNSSQEDGASTKILVGFRENASAKEITEAIAAVNGKMMDGPSALGLYTIRIPVLRKQREQVEQAIETLRKRETTISFAAESQ